MRCKQQILTNDSLISSSNNASSKSSLGQNDLEDEEIANEAHTTKLGISGIIEYDREQREALECMKGPYHGRI